MRNLTKQEIDDIPRLKAEGYTTRGIARLFKVHQTSVNYWIRRLEQAGHAALRDRMGRPAQMKSLDFTTGDADYNARNQY